MIYLHPFQPKFIKSWEKWIQCKFSTQVILIFIKGMCQNAEDMQMGRQQLKPKSLQMFLSLFQHLTMQSQKSKEKNSSKVIQKRLVYERDFNQILDNIQKDTTQFSSYLVVILGADQISSQSTVISDDVDSSNNQRQLNQLLYSQINRKIQKNYYHIVMLGTHLNNFLTKQGKLKKHIKNAFHLLEIDLIKKNLAEHFEGLQNFINS